MCMALVTFFFVVGSIRTNVVLWLVFVFIDLAFIMLMAVYWTLAEGRTDLANRLQTVSGRPHPCNSFIKISWRNE
jgi:succinate-acetate transporter protein